MKDKETRAERILRRAIAYNNGTIDADTFVLLEQYDDVNNYNDYEDRMISYSEIQSMLEVLRPTKIADPASEPKGEPKPKTKKEPSFSISMDEFNALSIVEQMELYNEHPDEIRALLTKKPPKDTRLSKEAYMALPLAEQSRIYRENPDDVKALVDGKLPYIESEISAQARHLMNERSLDTVEVES